MSEKELADRLAKGDAAALEKVIEGYSGYVRTIARNLSGGALAAEDIDELTADTFYKLWCYKANLSAELGLHAYLSAITRSVTLNFLRRVKPAAVDIDELELPSDFDVSEAAEISDLLGSIAEGLKSLPEKDREIFLRFYLYGESSYQISKVMKIPENTIYTKLRRTKPKLKEFLKKRGHEHV